MGEYAPPADTTTGADSSVHLEVVDRDGQPGQAPVVDLPDVIADLDLDLDDDSAGSDDDVVDADDLVDVVSEST